MTDPSPPRNNQADAPRSSVLTENMLMMMAQLQAMVPLMRQMQEVLGSLTSPSPIQPMRLFPEDVSRIPSISASPSVPHADVLPLGATVYAPRLTSGQGEIVPASDAPAFQMFTPLCAALDAYVRPAKFRPPHFASFDGSRNPDDHIDSFADALNLYSIPEGIRCLLLASTLIGPARL